VFTIWGRRKRFLRCDRKAGNHHCFVTMNAQGWIMAPPSRNENSVQGSGPQLRPLRAFKLLPAQPPYAALFLPGPGDSLVISFASIGHDPARAPSPEFLGSASAESRPVLVLTDASRSWTNAPGFAETLQDAVNHVKSRQTITRTLLIGQSMGAFAALVAATLIPADAVLAIGPQYSVDPALQPENRWAGWTRQIPTFRHPTAPFAQGPRITLMHGMADDLPQALAFPQRKGVDHILFPGLTHSTLAPHLKQRGCLPGLIDAALSADRRRLLRILASAGGQRRDRLADQLPR
jgi:pimeloyl-ACP methyl ester carboxylesterase